MPSRILASSEPAVEQKAFALAAHLVFLHGIGVSGFLAGMLDTSFYIRLCFHCMAFGSLAKWGTIIGLWPQGHDEGSEPRMKSRLCVYGLAMRRRVILIMSSIRVDVVRKVSL